MLKKTKYLSLVGGGVFLIFQFFLAPTAFAHFLEIEAEAICDTLTGETIIRYTSTAFNAPLAQADQSIRGHSQIDIYVNGILVQMGAYFAPDYSFSGFAPAPTSFFLMK
jgi:hypothetical protein